MGLILLVVACAALVALLRGGRVSGLGEHPVRRWNLVLAALVIQVIALVAAWLGTGPAPVSGFAVAACVVLVGMFCLSNPGLGGVALVGLGLLCDVLVIGVDGAMPVSRHAVARAGATMPTGGEVGHTPADRGTALGFLGQVVPVPIPGHREVVSVGELLMAAGAAQFVLGGMARTSGGPGGRLRSPGVGARSGSDRRRRNHPDRAVALLDPDSELVRVFEPPAGDDPIPRDG